jgi:hypothetical protein
MQEEEGPGPTFNFAALFSGKIFEFQNVGSVLILVAQSSRLPRSTFQVVEA